MVLASAGFLRAIIWILCMFIKSVNSVILFLSPLAFQLASLLIGVVYRYLLWAVILGEVHCGGGEIYC